MDACIEKVMAQGHEKSSAIAICCSSLNKEKRAMPNSNSKIAKQKAAERRRLRDLQSKAAIAQQALAEAEEAEEPETEKHWGEPEMAYAPSPPYGGALTLADALAAMDAQEKAAAIGQAAWIFQSVTDNILVSEDVADKGAAIAKAARELQALLNDPGPLLKEVREEPRAEKSEQEDKKEIETPPAPETLEAPRSKSVVDSLMETLTGAFERWKEGRRHSSKDNEMLQTIHNNAVSLGAECDKAYTGRDSSLTVFKDAAGKYRWVSFSSSAYEDRDKEIISRKALAADVARADKEKDYGPLLWWHTPGAVLGECDYNAMQEKILVESGTFANDVVAESVKAQVDNLEISIGFKHPEIEPDKDGIFNTIRRKERSLLPKGKASNTVTQLLVKEVDMEKDKQEALEKLLGKEQAQAVIEQADKRQKEADDAGLRSKESRRMSDMTEEEFGAALEKAVAPLAERLTKLESAGEGKSEKATAEQAEREKAVNDRLAGIETGLTAALAGVSELKGDLPRAFYRPSQEGKPVAVGADGKSVADERFKSAFPQADPLAPFLNALAPGLTQAGQ